MPDPGHSIKIRNRMDDIRYSKSFDNHPGSFQKVLQNQRGYTSGLIG